MYTPENLTWEDIKSWDGKTMRMHMAGPLRSKIQELALSRTPVEVQDLMVQQESNETPSNEIPSPVSEPQPEVAPEPVSQLPQPPQPKQKFVVEYQIRDEQGNPIGRLTHLEADTQEELNLKMREAHTQAVRAFHRLKTQKVRSIKEVVQTPTPVSNNEQTTVELLKQLKSDDPSVALEAHRKLTELQRAEVRRELELKEAERQAAQDAQKVTYEFLARHKHDYNNCEANALILKRYFQDNDLAWTLDNLEIALHALENELAPVAVPAPSEPPANPVYQTPAIPATPVAVQPVVHTAPTTMEQPAVPANPAPATPRPVFNGGLEPGQSATVRPKQTPKGLTIEEILSWDGPTMRAKMRSSLRAEIERVTREAQLTKGR